MTRRRLIGLTALMLCVLVAFAVDAPLSAQALIDYDTDDDNLIEISTLTQLNAIRYDPNGNGQVDGVTTTQGVQDSDGEFNLRGIWTGQEVNAFIAQAGVELATAFPDAATNKGCPDTCIGYELVANLDFDTNADGVIGPGDEFWNNGLGWVPIGFRFGEYWAEFNGNGYAIANLYNAALGHTIADLDTAIAEDEDISDVPPLAFRQDKAGLFDSLSEPAYVHHVALHNVQILSVRLTDTDSNSSFGALVGTMTSGTRVAASYATGRIINDGVLGAQVEDFGEVTPVNADNTGGLVGASGSRTQIVACWSDITMSGAEHIGGVVAWNSGTVTASYSISRLSGESGAGHSFGGVAGRNGGTITDSYFNSEAIFALAAPGITRTLVDATLGKTTAQLQSPTGYSGIYANWNVDLDGDGVNDDPWTFGTASDYPQLKGVAPPPAQSADAAQPPSLISLTVSPGWLLEGGGAQDVSVSAWIHGDGRFSQDVTLSLSLGGTAQAGTDFQPIASPAITIAAGQSQGLASFPLTTIDDQQLRAQVATIEFSAARSGVVINPAALVILDNDGASSPPPDPPRPDPPITDPDGDAQAQASAQIFDPTRRSEVAWLTDHSIDEALTLTAYDCLSGSGCRGDLLISYELPDGLATIVQSIDEQQVRDDAAGGYIAGEPVTLEDRRHRFRRGPDGGYLHREDGRSYRPLSVAPLVDVDLWLIYYHRQRGTNSVRLANGPFDSELTVCLKRPAGLSDLRPAVWDPTDRAWRVLAVVDAPQDQLCASTDRVGLMAIMRELPQS